MDIPDFQTMMLPLLQLAAERERHQLIELSDDALLFC